MTHFEVAQAERQGNDSCSNVTKDPSDRGTRVD